MNKKAKFVCIVAGEASADLHGSNLVRAMKDLDPGITFWGIGDEKMEDAGVKILSRASHMAVVGLTEIFSRLYYIFKAYFGIRHLLKKTRPDLLILMDYPTFNIPLAASAKRYKIPVLYYISPQVWAWRGGRVKKIAKRVDRMAVILPFEEAFYRDSGLNVEYVGHPLLDLVTHNVNRTESTKEMGIDDGYPIIGLLPGSRREEIGNLLPIMVRAVEIVSSRYPKLKCVLPLAPTVSADLVQPALSQSSVEIRISQGDIHKALSVCDLALVSSGTATLETAIMKVPMIVVYRISHISYWAAKALVKVSRIGLVNLVAGEEVAPELIQDDLTPQRLADEALDILDNRKKKEDMIAKLTRVVEKLGTGGASEKTARIALEMMNRR